jgi:hypothetical protein
MKQRSLIFGIVSFTVGISLMLGACTPAAPPEGKPAEEEPVMITICTGTLGGTSSLRGSAMAGILKEWLGIDSTVIMYSTTASIDAIHTQLVDIAAACYPHLTAPAYAGMGDYAADPYQELRALFTAADCPHQILVSADSPIRTFRDLIGKRLSPGKKGTIGSETFPLLCEALGLSEKDFDITWQGHPESATAMIAGKLDAYITPSTPPQPAFTEADLRYPIRLVGFTEEDIATIREKIPTFGRVEILPVWYHMDEPVVTVGPPSVVMASNRLPEDSAYGLVKNFVENPEFVGYYHISLKTDIESGAFKNWVETGNLGAPYHIGAYRYFKEVGWNVPAEMIPPEAK